MKLSRHNIKVLRANIFLLLILLICGISEVMSQNMNSYITLHVKKGTNIVLDFYAEPKTTVKIVSGKTYTMVIDTAPPGHIHYNVEEITAYADTMTIFGTIYEFFCSNNDIFYIDASHCPSLFGLACNGDQLDSLNVKGLSLLRELYCLSNHLTTLDLSGCSSLQYLECQDNIISSIDISSCQDLEWMFCYDNRISDLNISQNVHLGVLDCRYNQLTNLNVKNNTLLGTLFCGSNQLTSLDVSSLPYLGDLNCSDNLLTSLDVSKNNYLQYLTCYHNLFTTESFDELMCSLPDRSRNRFGLFKPFYDNKDSNIFIFTSTNSFNAEIKNWYISPFQGSGMSIITTGTFDCATVNINEPETEHVFGVYPNPANTTIHIHGGSGNILVYDITGRLIKNVPTGEDVSLDISSWTSGMYIVRCGRHTVKFIKYTSPNR